MKEGMSEKEKEAVQAKRAEENIKRLREFERHLKDAPKYQFNTNVFKKGVTFAPSEAEQVAKDEALVTELAVFVKDQAIPKLLRDLQAVEGVPTDSESLSQAFHSHGLNMRYLGAVHQAVGTSNQHLRTLLERDALVRAAKHLINAQLREADDSQVARVLSHLFNLVLAPQVMLKKMDEGEIAGAASTVEASVAARAKEESKPVQTTTAEEKEEASAVQEEKKKQSKKQKKKEEKKT